MNPRRRRLRDAWTWSGILEICADRWKSSGGRNRDPREACRAGPGQVSRLLPGAPDTTLLLEGLPEGLPWGPEPRGKEKRRWRRSWPTTARPGPGRPATCRPGPDLPERNPSSGLPSLLPPHPLPNPHGDGEKVAVGNRSPVALGAQVQGRFIHPPIPEGSQDLPGLRLQLLLFPGDVEKDVSEDVMTSCSIDRAGVTWCSIDHAGVTSCSIDRAGVTSCSIYHAIGGKGCREIRHAFLCRIYPLPGGKGCRI